MQISDSLEPRKLDANDGADCRGGTASLQTVTGCKFHLAGPAQGRQGHCGEGMVAHSAAADTQDGISAVFLKPKTGRRQDEGSRRRRMVDNNKREGPSERSSTLASRVQRKRRKTEKNGGC